MRTYPSRLRKLAIGISPRNLALVGFVAGAGLLAAQDVTTAPIGYVKLGNTTEGEDAVAANKDVYLSIPLEGNLEETRQILSTTATTITVEGSPEWSTSPQRWAPDPTPFCGVISSGAENGLRCVISSNTVNTLTVELTSPGDLSNVSAGDTLKIRRCWTLLSFFEPMNLPGGAQILLRDETLAGINQLASESFILAGVNWRNPRTGVLSNDVILHPGETFVLRSPATAIPELVLFGDVPTGNLRVNLTKDGAETDAEDFFIASMNPVPVLLSTSNFPVSGGDILSVFSPEGSGINQLATRSFIFTGTGVWRNTVTGENVSPNLTLDPGVGYIIRRSGSSPASAEWNELPPTQNRPSN